MKELRGMLLHNAFIVCADVCVPPGARGLALASPPLGSEEGAGGGIEVGSGR